MRTRLVFGERPVVCSVMFKCIVQLIFIVIVDCSFAAFLVFSWATYDTHAKLAKRQLTIKLLAWGSKQYLAGSWNNKVDFFVVLVSDAVYLIEKFFTKGLSNYLGKLTHVPHTPQLFHSAEFCNELFYISS
mgnify:CR=1 FL=1